MSVCIQRQESLLPLNSQTQNPQINIKQIKIRSLMAGLIRSAAQRTLFSSSSAISKALANGLQRQSRNATSTFSFRSSPYSSDTITKSPFEANILRILRNEIDYQIEYAPPHQVATTTRTFLYIFSFGFCLFPGKKMILFFFFFKNFRQSYSHSLLRNSIRIQLKINQERN